MYRERREVKERKGMYGGEGREGKERIVWRRKKVWEGMEKIEEKEGKGKKGK